MKPTKFYRIVPYNFIDVKIRRILWKIDNISKNIPWGYRTKVLNERPRLRGKKKYSEPVEEYDKAILRAYKHRNRLKRSRLWHWPQGYDECFFLDLEEAKKFCERFDDEGFYYTWVRITRSSFMDSERENREEDFEVINNSLVDKTDVWYRLQKQKEWGERYKEEDPPDYMKSIFC